MSSVSLIIPCYNHSDTLGRAVVSGLAQDVLQEIIIVDDHSTDGSLDVAHKLAEGDARIRVMQTECNIGPGGARNAGVRAAYGSHVSFLDADDELLGNFFSEALEMVAAHPAMWIIKGEVEFFDPVKGYILPQFDPRHGSAVLSSSCGMVMDRNTFLHMGGFSENHAFRGPCGGEDVAFMEAVIAHFQPIGRIEHPCYRVWSRSGSHTDKFLANTRLKGDSFEFVRLHPDQMPDGLLSRTMAAYLADVSRRLMAENNVVGRP